MTGIEHVAELLKHCETGYGCRTVCSRAYYSSFRLLITLCSENGFDKNEPTAPGEKHKGVHRRLFDFMRTSSIPILSRIGKYRIEDLYSLRVDADYTFGAPTSRDQAVEAVRLAEEIYDWIVDGGLHPGSR